MEKYGDHTTASQIAYIAIQSTLSANSNSGINFIVDAPFNGSASAPELLENLNNIGFVARSILVVCTDRNAWERRLQARALQSSPNHLLTSLDEIVSFRGTLESFPLEGEPVLDTAPGQSSIGTLTKQCVDYVLNDS
jgi:hypothetical protein